MEWVKYSENSNRNIRIEIEHQDPAQLVLWNSAVPGKPTELGTFGIF